MSSSRFDEDGCGRDSIRFENNPKTERASNFPNKPKYIAENFLEEIDELATSHIFGIELVKWKVMRSEYRFLPRLNCFSQALFGAVNGYAG